MKTYLYFIAAIILFFVSCHKDEPLIKGKDNSHPDFSVSPPSNNIIDFDVNDVYNGNGQKPIAEYSDKCQGAQAIWNMSFSNNREVVGLLTSDGKIMIVAMLGYDGGSWGGLYPYYGTTYYTYPESQGATLQSYTGLIQSAHQYFIPIVATIHTHNPCIQMGGNGISDIILSQGDHDLAARFQNNKHYIIGCDALGSFNQFNDSPILLQSGSLSNTCNQIQ